MGGVKKEFFLLLWRELLDPKYGMFKEYEESKRLWFNSDSLEDSHMYTLIGILCGLAIYNQTIINLPFPTAMYKKLLNEGIDLSDMEDLSPIMAKYVVLYKALCFWNLCPGGHTIAICAHWEGKYFFYERYVVTIAGVWQVY